jgi:hypothetical protein
MKEKINISTDDTEAENRTQDDGRIIKVDKGGVAEIHEKDGRNMRSGPDLPYDVTERHSSATDEQGFDMAREAADHEVAVREAKKKARLISEDAYYNITSPIRTPD